MGRRHERFSLSSIAGDLDGKGLAFNRRGIKRNLKSALLAAGMAVAAVGYAQAADMPVKAPPVKAVPFFFVNDTSISFTYFPNSTDPGSICSVRSVPGGIFGQGNTFARLSGQR